MHLRASPRDLPISAPIDHGSNATGASAALDDVSARNKKATPGPDLSTEFWARIPGHRCRAARFRASARGLDHPGRHYSVVYLSYLSTLHALNIPRIAPHTIAHRVGDARVRTLLSDSFARLLRRCCSNRIVRRRFLESGWRRMHAASSRHNSILSASHLA